MKKRCFAKQGWSKDEKTLDRLNEEAPKWAIWQDMLKRTVIKSDLSQFDDKNFIIFLVDW